MPQTIVGLGGLLSDPSCCVLKNGRIASAVEQAKVSRHDRPGAFPDEAFQTALDVAGVKLEEIDCVVIARPFAPASESLALLELQARFPQSEIAVVEHHQAHAASAYYCSPFSSAGVLSIDRAGDYRSAVLYRGEGSQLTPLREMYFPDSLGDLFNRVTDLLGFESRADEHKVQWLSASGKPNYAAVFQKLLGRNGSAWPRFDRSYFDADRLTHGGFSARFFEECGLDPAQPFSPEIKADLASSLQTTIEKTIAAMLGTADNVHICLAGGLALNSFLIHSLEDRFQNVFVQPVGGNAGTSLGAVLHI
ncbi:MAG: hypothetical protein JOY85_07760, partial [Acidobacteriaceae bacterium]|nr:hypothetical protein [Acidobacteriaceae bacterium]